MPLLQHLAWRLLPLWMQGMAEISVARDCHGISLFSCQGSPWRPHRYPGVLPLGCSTHGVQVATAQQRTVQGVTLQTSCGLNSGRDRLITGPRLEYQGRVQPVFKQGATKNASLKSFSGIILWSRQTRCKAIGYLCLPNNGGGRPGQIQARHWAVLLSKKGWLVTLWLWESHSNFVWQP